MVSKKPIGDFILVINSNFRSATVFEISTLKAGKSLNFHTLLFFEAPSGETPLDIDVPYILAYKSQNLRQNLCGLDF